MVLYLLVYHVEDFRLKRILQQPRAYIKLYSWFNLCIRLFGVRLILTRRGIKILDGSIVLSNVEQRTCFFV